MALVTSKFEFKPFSDIFISKIRIEGEGLYNNIDFINGKILLKDIWYEIEIKINEITRTPRPKSE